MYKINTKAFTHMLKTAKNIFKNGNKRSSIKPCIIFEGAGYKLHARASWFESEMKMSFDQGEHPESKFYASVSYDEFLNFISKIKDDAYISYNEESTKIKIETENTSAEFYQPSHPDDYIKPIDIPESLDFQAVPEWLPKALYNASKFFDETRYQSWTGYGVFMRFKEWKGGDTMEIFSSDGHTLYHKMVDCKTSPQDALKGVWGKDGDTSIGLRVEVISLLKRFPKDGNLEMQTSDDGKMIYFKGNMGKKYSNQHVEMTFGNHDQNLPDVHHVYNVASLPFEYSFNRASMLSAMKELKSFCDRKNKKVKVTINTAKGSIRLEAVGKSYSERKLVINTKTSPDFLFFVNPEYIIKAMESFDDEEIIMHCKDALSPLVFSGYEEVSSDGLNVIVMPMSK